MALFRPGRAFLLLILIIVSPRSGRSSESQAWFGNSLSVKMSPNWQIKVTQELKSAEITYEDTFLHNWSAGMFRSLPAGYYAGFAYKREAVERSGPDIREERLQIEGGWVRALGSDSRIDVRLRSEFRNFENPSIRDHTRLRLRLRLRRKTSVGHIALEPFVSTELFQSSASEVVVFRNRFAAGTTVALHSRVNLVVNYLRQDTRNREPLHVLNTGFDVKF